MTFLIFIDIFDLLIDNLHLSIDSFNLLINFDQSFNEKIIKIDQLKSKKDQNYIEIAIVDTIVNLESDLYHNRRLNPDGFEFESWTIRLGSLSLQQRYTNKLN